MNAKERLCQFYPYLRDEIDKIKLEEPNSSIKLAIISANNDMGRIVASFECEEFFDDILKVLGFQTLDDLKNHLQHKKI